MFAYQEEIQGKEVGQYLQERLKVHKRYPLGSWIDEK